MKYNLKNMFAFLVLASGMFAACSKSGSLPYYASGSPVTLSSSVQSLAAAPADSLNDAIDFSWSNPGYATDSASVKYIIQMDSSGRNFSHAASFTVSGALHRTFTAKEINDVLLGFGFDFNVAYQVDVRVVSSYANNNDQKISNVLTLQMTPYKVPPKVMPPASGSLFLVGDATVSGWSNPVITPAQQFKELDSVTYQGDFYLIGGKQYLILPVNGSWDQKYALQDNSVTGISAGGDFGYYASSAPSSYNSNFLSPAKTGIYTIWLSFQTGKFKVTAKKVFDLLYVPGDYQGWSPSSAPNLASTANDGNYEGYVNISSTGGFKFTSEADWNGTNYGDTASDGMSGVLNPGGGNNLNIPAAGFYRLTVNTGNNTWTYLQTQWSLMGSFSASGWSNDVDLTYDPSSNTWKGTITAADGDVFKFRANHDWGLNYGDNGADGSLEQGGDNIPLTAGTHNITLYLGNGGYYSYSIQ